MSTGVHPSLRTAAKGTVLVFSGMLVSQLIWFMTRLLIVRNLSKDELGIYSLLIAIVGIVSLLACVGLCEGSTRYISVLSGQDRKEDADAVHRSSLRIGAIAGAGACVILFLLSGVLSGHVFYKPELAGPLMVMAFFIPADVIASILAAVLRGYGIISPKVYFLDLGQPFLFLLLLCPVFLFGLPFIGVIYAYVLSMAAVCVLIALGGYHKTGIKPFPVTERKGGNYVRELLKFSVPVLSLQWMSLIFRSADTLMLGRYGSAEEVGVYSVSVSLAVLLSLPLVALGYVYMPVAGELYAKKRSPDLARTYQVLTKWIFAATLPMFFILFFFPEMTITFLFGERFADSALPLRILSLGYLFSAFAGTNSMLLLVLGRSGDVMKISAAGAVLNVLLNYVLIKHLGLGTLGAALSSMVSLLAVSFGYSFVLYRFNGMHPLASAYLKPVVGSAVLGTLIYAAAKGLPLYFWMLPLYFFLYICGYVGSLFLTRSIDDEDLFLFGEVLKRAGVAPETTKRVVEMLRKGETEKSSVR